MNGRVPIVLLIEPDAIQRATLAPILKAAGYSVIPVGRAHEALETFATHHVDIALVVANTQTTAPGGPPLLDTLSAIDPHVPIVVLSAGVAIERPAYEYPNVAVTLMKPFEPTDVLASVQRVLLSAVHEAAPVAEHTPAAARRAIGLDGAFNWPPTEEDLDDIQVVDTTAWQEPDAQPQAQLQEQLQEQWQAQPHAQPPAEPEAIVPVAMLADAPTMDVMRPEAVHVVRAETMDVVRIETMDIVRVEPALPSRLMIRGLERRQWTYGPRISARTRRSLSVAATAFCGLALTTLLELRGVPARHAPPVDETAPEVANLPLVSASHHPVGTMPLVSARRVRPRRAAADIIGHTPRNGAPRNVTPRHVATRKMATHDVSSAETRSAAARALAPAPLVAPTAATPTAAARRETAPREAAPSPSPAGVASHEMTEAPAARNVMSAAHVPAPAVTLAVSRSGEDERGIYQVLQRYERAYERLDVNAARAVWPSIDARALARAFDGLKAQALEFSHCRVALELSEAIAICGGNASYVPRVGRQAARTERREWTFRLRKVDHDWLIAKAEVR